MQTTERMRRALAWCDTRGLSPTTVTTNQDVVTINFHTRNRPELESREAFVSLARAAGCLHVGFNPRDGAVWAQGDPDGFDVAVFAGDWARSVPPSKRAALVEDLGRDLLAVNLSEGVGA